MANDSNTAAEEITGYSHPVSIETEGYSHPIIKDPQLISVMESAIRLQNEVFGLLDFLDAHPLPQGAQHPEDTKVEISYRHTAIHSHLAELRGKHRDVMLRVRRDKEETAKARLDVDVMRLELQNLIYEQEILKGEIEACKNYEHIYDKLPLIPIEQFLQLRPELDVEDEKILMMARIDHEYAERQKLEDERQALLKQKMELIAENNKRKEDLANLDKDLEKFIEAAQPIMQTFEKEYK
ncbi:hypothetical protein NA57DRAFT_76181 [Rhizodiscina lignyota]|uniref:THO complex subunit 5 n=1 Tax=Rhizodiscina lignyota TaxID=1504668 RepID=A0A9P4IGN7_9PEZI|nr:hypothetical protein NA57DRAFT_76181 [Rhizodiscina lignyota]